MDFTEYSFTGLELSITQARDSMSVSLAIRQFLQIMNLWPGHSVVNPLTLEMKVQATRGRPLHNYSLDVSCSFPQLLQVSVIGTIKINSCGSHQWIYVRPLTVLGILKICKPSLKNIDIHMLNDREEWMDNQSMLG